MQPKSRQHVWRKERRAWELFTSTPTMRMLGLMSTYHLPETSRSRRAFNGEVRSREDHSAVGARPEQAGSSNAVRIPALATARFDDPLDDALDDTFPASDPPAILMPSREQ